MKYQTQIDTIDDFYQTLYCIPPRLSRETASPKDVTQRLLAAVNNPQKNIRSILITGSKGKGSTAIILSTLLSRAGSRVGLFSSPHLFDFRERIKIDDKLIPTRSLIQLAKRVLAAANALEIHHPDEFPRFFEITTVIAYLYFSEQNVDYAVIEAGIGALTDATNQDDHCLAILTTIEPEHLDIFHSMENLAIEKAGVMLPNVPLILGDLSEDVDQIIIDRASQLAVPIIRFKNSFLKNNKGFFPIKIGHTVWVTDSKLKAKNTWMALTAFKQLGETLSDEDKVSALNHVKLPAREEIVSQKPLIVIDSAHTPMSAQNLAQYIAKQCPKPSGKLVLLVSFSAKKNIDPVIKQFADAQKIVITQASDSRSLLPKTIKKHLEKSQLLTTPTKIKLIDSPKTALKKTLAKLKKNDILVITGSVYLAGLLSREFQRNKA